MAVHFMFAASKQFESVPVEGDSIALGRLKDEIFNLKFRAALEKRSAKERFDFRVFDAESKEEILGARTKVPRHSRVVVKRLPAFVVSQAEKQQQALQPITNPSPRACPVDDGFGDDVFSTPAAPRGSSDRNQPAASYVRSDRNRSAASCVSSRRNQPAASCVSSDTNQLSANSATRSSSHADVALETSVDREIPRDLACSVCHDIMKDAVLIPCCCTSFCRSCVTAALSLYHKCPSCASSKCKPSDVLPNRSLNASVALYLKTNGTLTSSQAISITSSCTSAQSGLSSEHKRSESITANPGEKRKLAPPSISPANAKRTKPLIISLAKKAKFVS